MEVLSNISDSDEEKYLKLNDGSEVTKTLGLAWDQNSEKVLVSFLSFSHNKRITKRTVLSVIALFYEPLGLIGPIIVKTKIFLQLL